MSPCNRFVPLVEAQQYIIDAAHPRCTLNDSVEDRLHVCRRTADDAEHLRRCRLMLQGLVQFCVALLQFLEQPDVFDGDDGLICEGLEKFNLIVSEGLDSAGGEGEIHQ